MHSTMKMSRVEGVRTEGGQSTSTSSLRFCLLREYVPATSDGIKHHPMSFRPFVFWHRRSSQQLTSMYRPSLSSTLSQTIYYPLLFPSLSSPSSSSILISNSCPSKRPYPACFPHRLYISRPSFLYPFIKRCVPPISRRITLQQDILSLVPYAIDLCRIASQKGEAYLPPGHFLITFSYPSTFNHRRAFDADTQPICIQPVHRIRTARSTNWMSFRHKSAYPCLRIVSMPD